MLGGSKFVSMLVDRAHLFPCANSSFGNARADFPEVRQADYRAAEAKALPANTVQPFLIIAPIVIAPYVSKLLIGESGARLILRFCG